MSSLPSPAGRCARWEWEGVLRASPLLCSGPPSFLHPRIILKCRSDNVTSLCLLPPNPNAPGRKFISLASISVCPQDMTCHHSLRLSPMSPHRPSLPPTQGTLNSEGVAPSEFCVPPLLPPLRVLTHRESVLHLAIHGT